MATDAVHLVCDRRDMRPQDTPSVVWRKLTFGYLLAVGLIATLTVAMGLSESERLEMMERDAATINIAGAQRMLSQRTAALASDLTSDREETRLAAADLLRETLARLAASHERLTRRPDGPAFETAALQSHYFADDLGIDARVGRFIAAATALAGRVDTGLPADRAQVDAVRAEALGPLLEALHVAVALHQEASERRLARAADLHLFKVAMILATLGIEALFLFRPLVNRVTRLTAALEREARIDPLTGVLNRGATVQALARVMAAGEPIAVVAIDLDHFKEANDTDGHEAGDALLRAAATRLSESVRRSDTVGRLGGDEFAVFMPGVSETEAAAIAERIRDSLHQPVPYEQRLLRLGATVGFAMAPTDATCPKLLLRIADEALIRAKQAGRGSIGRGSRDDAERLLRAAAIARAFDEASAGQRIEGIDAHFLPVLSVGESPDQALPVAFEALARWSHPAVGMVPISEVLASIGPRQAFRLCHEVRAAALARFAEMRGLLPFPARLSLNLSAREIMRSEIAEEIVSQAREASLPPSAIDIEITEEALLGRISDGRLASLVALREQGVRLVLDDFGTGSASLMNLLRLPLDGLKIDRRFIAALGADARAEEIIRATIGLARGLGIAVVAEGVETEAQATELRKLGCRLLQGYLFAQPMDSAGTVRWLETTFGPPRPRALNA